MGDGEGVQSGALGEIHKVHLTWNRNQPRGKKQEYGIDPKTVDWKGFLGSAREQAFDEYRFRNWRRFWNARSVRAARWKAPMISTC